MGDKSVAFAPFIIGNAPEARDQTFEILRVRVLGVAFTPHHESPDRPAR